MKWDAKLSVIQVNGISLVSAYNVPFKERPMATGTLPACLVPVITHRSFCLRLCSELYTLPGLRCKKKKQEERREDCLCWVLYATYGAILWCQLREHAQILQVGPDSIAAPQYVY